MDAIPVKGAPPDMRTQKCLGRMASLCELTTTMFDSRDENDVLKLAASWIASLGSSLTAVGYLQRDGRLLRGGTSAPEPEDRAMDSRVRALSGKDTALDLPGFAWAWALALTHRSACLGYLVVRSPATPADDETYLATLLARQTAAALDHVQAGEGQRERVRQLRLLNHGVTAVNECLRTEVAELQRRMVIAEVLNRVSFSGEGEQGIVRALHELTGFPALAEDRFGNLRAWAGPDGSERPAAMAPGHRAAVLRRAERERRPVRDGDLLVRVVRPHGEVLGVLVLADPEHQVGETETFALDQAATVLALELSHERGLADADLRMQCDLVEDLVTGTDEQSAFARSEAVGHNLHGSHHVVVVKWTGPWGDGTVTVAVGRAAAASRLDFLLGRRSGAAILIVRGPAVGDEFYDEVSRELGSADGVIGVGGQCDAPSDFSHSYQEALRALEIRQNSLDPHGLIAFDRLGLYRVLRTSDHDAHTEQFVREWLGPLIDYDQAHHGELVATLTAYLENSSYDATAAMLAIHRSTLRYRLRRIREISGLDITDVEVRLNLHVAARIWNVITRPL
ncbi:PucR family transcriptional regulator [Streptantibioticus ferralitis]|uniref:Helix-turn-helix domain-containing protein n=1 Tax=Streptantibioticus ferralitis TaxID=236510 RepID=A0ABT5YYR1_9ACTN|nr:helix-turn-helix domain-containing protein [Streptantibioticus ferralitis]MDF2256729.1 helix-turn-helix domain-containing protein [Streptantibioticus ferralitis]